MLLRTSYWPKTYNTTKAGRIDAGNAISSYFKFTGTQARLLALLSNHFSFLGRAYWGSLKPLQAVVHMCTTAICNAQTAHMVRQPLSAAKSLWPEVLPFRQANLAGIGQISALSRLLSSRTRYYYKVLGLSKQSLLRTAATQGHVFTFEQLRISTNLRKRGMLGHTSTQSYYDDAAVSVLLIRFLEFLVQTRVSLLIARSPYTAMSAEEVVSISLFRGRLTAWLGQGVGQWHYTSTMLLLLFKTADATIITSWLHTKLSRMSLFGHGRFLSTFFFFLGIFYDLRCTVYGLAGIKIRVAGKISVAGNARKRAMQFTRGKTSSGSINTKVSSDFYLVRTSTGCLGLTVWLFYH